MNEALDLILDSCALVRMKIRNPQELWRGGGGGGGSEYMSESYSSEAGSGG